MEENPFNFVTRLKKPIAVGGFIVVVLYLLFRAVLGLKIFSPLGEDKTFALLNSIVTLIFVLALFGEGISVVAYVLENTQQSYVIKGNVQSTDGRPVKDATVFVIGFNTRIETNTEGWFEIKAGKQELWTVKAQSKGNISEKTVARKDIQKPIILTIGAAEKTDTRKSTPPNIAIGDEYDRWYRELFSGKLSEVSPENSRQVDLLTHTLVKVLKEKNFEPKTITRVETVFNELITNVARHVDKGKSKVKFEINTSQLPYVIVSVADNGEGFKVLDEIQEQALRMKSGEH